MKILQFPAYVTINKDNDFNRNISGYGYMTLDIATSLAQSGIDIDLLTQSNFTKGKTHKKIHIIKRTFFDVILNLKIKHIFWALTIIIKDKIPLSRVPNILLYNISMGYFEKILRKGNYNLVHIHGIGYYTNPIIRVCEKIGVKYLVTLHGLNSFSDSVNITLNEKKIEKVFLRKVYSQKVPISVISSGIKEDIFKYLNITSSEFIYVVPNGCNRQINHNSSLNIRQKYNLKDNVKIFLCIGNICMRKNQMQIVRAYNKLSSLDKNKIVFLFLGKDMSNGGFKKTIEEYGFQKKLILCGNIDRNEIKTFYDQANYNIIASISEGFGLSMIEGFNFGIPSITFNDLDAITDVYNKKAMLLVKERTDKALAKGISDMIKIDWEKEYILAHSKQFSLQNMANHYSSVFEQII
jgi:glycosyltransferase involved in cell wall biosynthesis